MLHKTNGIVLKKQPLGDTGFIAVLFPREFGKIKVASSKLGQQEKLGGVLDLLSYNELFFVENSFDELNTVVSVETIDKFPNVCENLDRYSAVMCAIETVLELTAPWDKHEDVFTLLFRLLRMLDDKNNVTINPYLCVSLFQVFLLRQLGYHPGDALIHQDLHSVKDVNEQHVLDVYVSVSRYVESIIKKPLKSLIFHEKVCN